MLTQLTDHVWIDPDEIAHVRDRRPEEIQVWMRGAAHPLYIEGEAMMALAALLDEWRSR